MKKNTDFSSSRFWHRLSPARRTSRAMQKFTTGFTLIELLVVISIIALLASIVLASLSSATNKAGDSSVRAGMKQLSAQLQIAAGSGGFGASYSSSATTNCGNSGVFANTQVQSIFVNLLSNAASGATFTCNTDSTGNKWAVSISALKGGGSWCIDNSSHIETGTASGGSCP